MPYLNKIFGAISTTVSKPAVIDAREAWIRDGGVNKKVYDGRPKLASGTNAFWNNEDKIVELTWLDNSKITSYFQLQRKINSGSWSNLATITAIAGQQLYEYNDAYYVNGNVQHYRVYSHNIWGTVTAGVLEDSATIDTSSGGGATISANPIAITFYLGEEGTTKDVIITSSTGDFTFELDPFANWIYASKINATTLRVSMQGVYYYGDSGMIKIMNTSGAVGYIAVSYGEAT